MTERVLNIEEICEQRLTCIRELEKEFESSPSKGKAIILRDLWKNWKEANWEDYASEKPSEKEILTKIASYSAYATN